MAQTFAFRIRVDRGPTDTIDCSDSELVLLDVGPCRVCLRNKTLGEPLKDALQFVLVGEGYATDTEARAAANFFETVMMIALAKVRVGVDFGQRTAKGAFTGEGIRWREELHSQRVLNDVHGVMIYETFPEPKFDFLKASMIRHAGVDSFLQAFKSAHSTCPSLSERERLAYTPFNASFFQPAADSRFILLVMAIEALIELSPRSVESQAHVKSLMQATKVACIPLEERNSMIGALRWLAKESISQAGKRTVASLLGAREYAGRQAEDFFAHVYQMRSNLVHGNLPYPTAEEVRAIAAPLEVFVSDLLTQPILEPCTTL